MTYSVEANRSFQEKQVTKVEHHGMGMGVTVMHKFPTKVVLDFGRGQRVRKVGKA